MKKCLSVATNMKIPTKFLAFFLLACSCQQPETSPEIAQAKTGDWVCCLAEKPIRFHEKIAKESGKIMLSDAACVQKLLDSLTVLACQRESLLSFNLLESLCKSSKGPARDLFFETAPRLFEGNFRALFHFLQSEKSKNGKPADLEIALREGLLRQIDNSTNPTKRATEIVEASIRKVKIPNYPPLEKLHVIGFMFALAPQKSGN